MRARTLSLIGLFLLFGCASMSGSKDQYFVCSYEIVWDAALQSVKDQPIQLQDKSKGLIETGWVEMEGDERTYGIFAREGFGNRERVRLTVAVKQMTDVTSVSVLENRQRWHLKGGVGQLSTRWWPIDPSEQTEANVINRVSSTIKEKGCSTT